MTFMSEPKAYLGHNKEITIHNFVIFHSNFKFSGANSCSITCSYKASSGLLYPLERGFIFVHKPAVHIRFDEIANVNFARGSTTGRTFDFEIELKHQGSAGTVVTFSSLPRFVGFCLFFIFLQFFKNKIIIFLLSASFTRILILELFFEEQSERRMGRGTFLCQISMYSICGP